ncbi:MAG: MBL fold metallo-hydrolase [Clostridia bacterium]|nr:MBL fold metallo-hydrolase [Clostridia bacterium]
MEFAVKYHFHSGFSIEFDNYFMLFDFYKGTLPAAETEKAEKPFVFVSHGHADHYNESVLSLKNNNPDTVYIMPKDLAVSEEVIYMLPDQKLNIKGILIETFDSTDEGLCYLITYKGVKIFHAGDLNLWSWRNDSKPREIVESEKSFYRIVNKILRTTDKIDIAFFPVDHRMVDFYEEGAVRMLRSFEITHFFPMHMWKKYSAADILDKYNFKNTVIYKINDKNKNFKIHIQETNKK